MDYEQIIDDEPFVWNTDDVLRMVCCDCALTHDFILQSVSRKKLTIIARRNERVAALFRRYSRSGLQKGDNPNWILTRRKKRNAKKARKVRTKSKKAGT